MLLKKYPMQPCPAFRFIVLSMLVNFCGFSPGYKFILLINEWYTSKKIHSLNPTDPRSRNWTSGIEVTDSLFWKWLVVQHNPRNYRFRNWISGPPPSPSHLSTIYLTNSSTILYILVFQIIKYTDLYLNSQIRSTKIFYRQQHNFRLGGWAGRWCWVASSAGASCYFCI